MIDYRAPVADMLFILRHGAGADRLNGWDDELAGEILAQAARFVDGEIAPLDLIADAVPARLEDGRVRVPPEFVAAYAKYCEGGWPGLAIDEAHGGQGLPKVLGSAVSEMLSGACVSFQMLLSLAQGAARAIAAHGTAEQRARYLPPLASGEWLATMCLTEPQAGSDLGLVRSLATPRADGSWRISGGKIFTSGGDQDVAANIVHLVLARTPDAPPGVKGLSLFLCPAVLPDGGRNAVSVVRLEEKMGMHASPTCQLAFDSAWAEIVGRPGEGLARMFTMMNAERLDVAIQGIGLADVAGQRARAYAAERRQGRAAGGGETATINRHGDVRRMLLTQMALTMGCRAMVYRALVELELDQRPWLVEFMTPLCKSFATDSAVAVADLGIQVHGGYGYLKEYRAEQVLRDARITPIYEGTNGIQAMTLAGRLLHIENGACPAAFREDVTQAIADARSGGLGPAADQLQEALADWVVATEQVSALDDPGAVAAAYLRLSGLLALAVAWTRMEGAAVAAPSRERVKAVAGFTRGWLLPETAALVARIGSRPKLGDIAEGVFL